MCWENDVEMHVKSKILKGASFVSASEVVTQGCSLVRNIILARFLAKADFGVAAMLGMILTLFEMSSKMALGQQVVQSKNGDEPGFIACIHFTQFASGTLSALLILVLAWPMASFFSGPQYFTAIMMLALIPFISGFNNLDVYRRTRHMSFGPQVLTETIPQLITTLAAWPIAQLFNDYRAVLCLLLGKAFLNALITHLLAERRFVLRFDRHWLRESLKFGGPLLLSGFVQFGNFQGDSMVVAAAYTMSQLGEYSVALTIAMALSVTVTRIGASVGLPLLAEVQSDAPQFTARYAQFVQTMALIGCLTMLGMFFCGEQLTVLLFGVKYAGIGTLSCWLIAAQTLRIVRGAVVTAAMAKGDTVNNLCSSLWRLSGLILAIGVGLMKASLIWFAVAAFIGEVAALISTVVCLSSRQSIAVRITFMPVLLAFACVLFIGSFKWSLSIDSYSIWSWLALLMAVSLSFGVFVICFFGLRVGLLGFASHLSARIGWTSVNCSRPTIVNGAALGSGPRSE